MCCGEYIRFQTQKQQQEPDTSLDGQMAKMALELFAVAEAYVPCSVASMTAAPLHYLQTRVVFCRLGTTNRFWLPNKHSVCSTLPMWMPFESNAPRLEYLIQPQIKLLAAQKRLAVSVTCR